MTEDETVRLFIGIPLPEFVKERLTAIHEDLPQLRWTKQDNIHLTLKFIGETEDELKEKTLKQLKSIQVKPFLLAVSDIGLFSKRGNPAVVWAGLGSAHHTSSNSTNKLTTLSLPWA